MTKFSAVAPVGDIDVRVEADTYEELHEQLAGLCELERESEYLRERGAEDIVPSYRKDDNDNEYFGFRCRVTRKDKTFGKKREKDGFPFFPRRGDTDKEAGYYDPNASDNGGGGRGSRAPRPQRPRRNGQAGEGSGDGDAKRLWATAQRTGYTQQEARWLLGDFGYQSFRFIKAEDVEALEKAFGSEERLARVRKKHAGDGDGRSDDLPF